LRRHAEPEHGNREHRHHGQLASVQVAERTVRRLVERGEQQALHCAQGIHRGEDDPRGRDDGQHGFGAIGAEQHEELAHESVGAGETDRAEHGEGEHHREQRHGARESAKGVESVAAAAFTQDAGEQKERAGRDAVVDHDHHRAFHALLGEGEAAEHDEAEMTDAGVREHLAQVGLHDGHEGPVHDRHERQHQNHAAHRLVHHGRRKERQREAKQGVGANLESEHDGPDHGRLELRVRQPGVKGHQRRLDREREEERAEQPQLRLEPDGELQQVVEVERCGAGGDVQHRDGRQHEQRAEHREHDVLDGRARAVLRAPDADDEVHRHEHELPGQVEQQQIERHEHAHEPAREREQQRAEAGHAGAHLMPGGQQREWHERCGEHEHGQRDAVHAKTQACADFRQPRPVHAQLPTGHRRIEGQPRHHARAPPRSAAPAASACAHPGHRCPRHRQAVPTHLRTADARDRPATRSPLRTAARAATRAAATTAHQRKAGHHAWLTSP
jgi:hypothetical protein